MPAIMVTGGAADSPSVEIQTARVRSSTALGEEHPAPHACLGDFWEIFWYY